MKTAIKTSTKIHRITNCEALANASQPGSFKQWHYNLPEDGET